MIAVAVYFARIEDGVGTIKIGCCGQTYQRAVGLARHLRQDVTILVTMAGSWSRERALRARFDAYRLPNTRDYFEPAAPNCSLSLTRIDGSIRSRFSTKM